MLGGKVTFKSNAAEIIARMRLAEDSVAEALSNDVKRLAQQKAPRRSAALQSAARVSKEGAGAYAVVFDLPYAAYQEFGVRSDGSHRVRRYSSAGTGAHFLQDAGDVIETNTAAMIESGLRGAGL